MKTVSLLILLSCFSVFGQTFSQTMAFRGAAHIKYTTPTSGGGGVPGAPAILTSATNNTSGGVSSLTCTVTVSGSQPALLLLVDWYSATATPNTPTGFTLWTNGIWYSDGNGKWRSYYKMSPAAGSTSVTNTWSANVDESTMYLSVLTNCSGFETSVSTNYNNGGGAMTITSTSQTKDLMIFYGANAITGGGAAPTLGGGQTLIDFIAAASGEHSGQASTKAGSASSDTSSMTFSDVPAGGMNGGAIGF